MGRNSRLQQWIGYRVRVSLHDARMLVGVMLAYDRHMNVVLADCEEFRLAKKKQGEAPREIKRVLGLVMLRGESVVSLTVEAPVKSGGPSSGHKGAGISASG